MTVECTKLYKRCGLLNTHLKFLQHLLSRQPVLLKLVPYSNSNDIQLFYISNSMILSSILGWFYFTCWSASFYPQVYLNHRTKTVKGLSFAFVALNLTGFLCYSVFNLVTFFSQHNSTVQPNDIAFALHALLLSLITAVQCILYKTRDQSIGMLYKHLLVLSWVFILIIVCLAVSSIVPWIGNTSEFTAIGALGYVKLLVSTVKYIPQVYLNWKRQSTVGWSIANILLDLGGGLGSLLQQILDSHSVQQFVSNVPKLALALLSITFDVVFIVQHYVLYSEGFTKVPTDSERIPSFEDEMNGIE